VPKEEFAPGLDLAWRADGAVDDGRRCGFFWLGGFMSDMTGTKAEAVAELARQTDRPCLRFDYSGHGASGGDFLDGTITGWLDQAVHMFERHTTGPRIVIGSSMGGWLALLLYRRLAGKRIAGLLLIAPATDMTAALMWQQMPPEARESIATQGVWHRPSAYGGPYAITRRLIDDGYRHLLLDGDIPVACPVHILQGDADMDVPWQHAKRTYDALKGDDIRLTLIKGGDHRLSAPGHLRIVSAAADQLARQVQ
jgi:pimeloyl-ACP methyl ester carboxylesterase